MPPKPTMETRLAILEQSHLNVEKTLGKLEQNLSRLVEIAGDISHMKEALDKAVERGDQNHTDINGLGSRISDEHHKLSDRTKELETRQNYHTRLWVIVGGALGGGIMWGVGRILYEAWTKIMGA